MPSSAAGYRVKLQVQPFEVSFEACRYIAVLMYPGEAATHFLSGYWVAGIDVVVADRAFSGIAGQSIGAFSCHYCYITTIQG